MIDISMWRAYAECQAENATYFYAPAHFERKPEKDHREGNARALCRVCRVQSQCLEYSLEVAESHGIWGGLNELERSRLLRRRRAEAEEEAAEAAEAVCSI
jgi:WhiB family transcriptional regulator, redox-sensing transcriptional regulator